MQCKLDTLIEEVEKKIYFDLLYDSSLINGPSPTTSVQELKKKPVPQQSEPYFYDPARPSNQLLATLPVSYKPDTQLERKATSKNDAPTTSVQESTREQVPQQSEPFFYDPFSPSNQPLEILPVSYSPDTQLEGKATSKNDEPANAPSNISPPKPQPSTSASVPQTEVSSSGLRGANVPTPQNTTIGDNPVVTIAETRSIVFSYFFAKRLDFEQ